MGKRSPLKVEKHHSADNAHRAFAQLTAAPRSRQQQPEKPREPTVTTAVHITKRTLALLRRVAAERANRDGKRASVSALLVAIVEAQRDQLEREITGG